MTYQYRENPEFSWSLSRQDTINDCKRKYFYKYYGKHNGWSKNATDEQKEAYRYDKITSLSLAFGSHVHETLKNMINNSSFVEENFQPTIKSMLRDTCINGKDINKWQENPKQFPILSEILYIGDFSNPDVKRLVNEIYDKLDKVDNVFETDTFCEIRDGKIKQILEVDEDFSNESCGKFDLDGYKVFSKIDFLYVRDDGKYIVTDWKTYGKEPKFEQNISNKDYRQLLLYTDYVHRKYNVPLNQIICRMENTLTGITFEVENISETEIKKLEKEIKENINMMATLVEETNLKVNKAIDISNFKRVGETSEDKKCTFCNFKGICWKTGK